MLDHRPIRVPSEAEIGWPCRPLIRGDWRDVPSTIAVAIAAEAARRSDMPIMLPSPIERMRALALAFYPRWFLVEGLARYTINAAGVFRMLIGPDELLLLNGTSPPIHALNARMLALGSSATTNQYLRFFCGVVHGEAGPFNIVESMNMLTVNPAMSVEDLARVRAAIRPIRLKRIGNAEIRSAAVVYGTALFRSRFRVMQGGMVEMLDDEPIMPDVLARAAAHDGIWEVFEEPGDYAGRMAS